MTAIKLQLWQKAMLLKLLKQLKECIKEIANIPTENKKEKLLQTKWPPIQNKRMKHQVINNKPKHLIKKIIRKGAIT